MPRVTIGDRVVFHRLGRKSQTISVCTPENRRGVYEERYSLDISVDIPTAELAAQPDVAALREWLIRHGGEPLSADCERPPVCRL